MKADFSVKKRVRYEALAICLLALVAAVALLARPLARRSESEAEAKDGDQSQQASSVPVPTEIPEDMFEWKPGQYVHVERGSSTSNNIDESLFKGLSNKTADGLVTWAQMAWENQWGYVWGTFGTVLDEDLLQYKIEQFGKDVEDYEDIIREKWMGRRTVDCAGLIKSYGWYDPEQHGIVYCHGDMPDIGTDGFYEAAPDKGPIDTLPEIPGLLVYADGHIGVYVGDGWAIEAISHAGGVVKTRVADRPWTYWLKSPAITY